MTIMEATKIPDQMQTAFAAVLVSLFVEHCRAVSTDEWAKAAGVEQSAIFRLFGRPGNPERSAATRHALEVLGVEKGPSHWTPTAAAVARWARGALLRGKDAANAVVQAWEGGDLAGAVHELAIWADAV